MIGMRNSWSERQEKEAEPRLKQVVEMHDLWDLSFSQIGERLSPPVSRARAYQLYQRGKDRRPSGNH